MIKVTKVWNVHSVVHAKILLSLLSFVLLIAMLSGIISYVFSRTYEKQVHADSQIALSHLGEQLDEQVFQQAHSLYADLIGNPVLYPEVASFLQGDDFDPVSYYRLYVSLRAALARSPEVFSSVSLYNRNEDSVVSSTSGVKWIGQQREGKYTDWVQMVLQSRDRLFWTYTPSRTEEGRTVAETDISMYAAYPANAACADCRGLVRIQLNVDSINKILQSYRMQQSAYYLIDREGQVVAGSGPSEDFRPLFGDRLSIMGEERQLDIYELDGEKTVVVSQPYRQGYILTSMTSLQSFYEKTNAARLRINLTGLGLLLLGLLLAAILSARLYRPIRQIVEPAQKRYGGMTDGLSTRDEYAYIRALMDELFSKASSTESILEENLPLIRNSLLQSLLYDSAIDDRVLQERIDFIHLALPYPLFCVLHLKIPASAFGLMNTEQKELILYGLLNGYGEYRKNEIRIHGIRSAPDTLSMIVNLTEAAWKRSPIWLHELEEVCVQYSGIRPQIAVGGCVQTLRGICDANKEAERLLPYFYFLTGAEYLTAAQVPALQNEEQHAIPPRILEDFAQHIQAYQAEEAQADVDGLVACCKTGRFTAQECNQQILSLLFLFSRFVRSMGTEENDPLYDKIHSDFLRCDDIDQFRAWFGALIPHHLQLLARQASGHYSEMMKRITAYIEEHLSEQISLDMLAETFRISTNYLGRLFKEEIGVYFTDYVNSAKLARAMSQLENTDKKIDQIAEETGFNSSAYFIKKFKQKYGVTPKKYRMDLTIRRQDA